MLDLYATIWRATGRRQVLLVLLAFAIAALAAVPLDLQKSIINALTAQSTDTDGLVRLCALMLGAILLSIALKWLLGYRSGLLGEDSIRRIRRRVYHRPEAGRQAIGGGTLATVISAEAEELGKFAGSAFAQPVLQVGTLVAVVGYIASAQPALGTIALSMVVPQVVIVLVTQRKVNALVGERVRVLRGATDRLDPQAADAMRQSVLDDFDRIYEIRRRMFVWKLSTKFLLSLINGVGTVAVLLLGGILVLDGRTDVGTVVAATVGLTRLQGPTTYLIAFYRQVSATRVKFELLREVALPRPAA